MEQGKLVDVRVSRGAPCGATWKAAAGVTGKDAGEAVLGMGLQTQFFCSADPAGWDPIMEKSPVHFAGKLHARALVRAIAKADPKRAAELRRFL